MRVITPREYESLVAAHFAGLGYKTHQTVMTGDYGVDIFAETASERLAIQAKKYGNTSRRVNRQMVMELHGAKDYFGCSSAVLVTDGELLPDAHEVATKLGVQVMFLPAVTNLSSNGTLAHPSGQLVSPSSGNAISFDQIWSDYVMPLAGCTLQGSGTRTNIIEKVDSAGVLRISSSGRRSRIDIEIFRLAINHILRTGSITRDEINQNYAKRASSGVVLILSQAPLFELTHRPLTLRLNTARASVQQ